MGAPPRTPHIEFRTWDRSDVALAASLWCDPRVMQFLGGPYERSEVLERLEREVANEAGYGVQYWPVFIADVFAGCCGLKPHEPEQRHYELGFHFRPEFWGRGNASEAARTVIAYAFESLDAAALFAGHHPENRASAALLAKLGFETIGTHFFARTGLDHAWLRLSSSICRRHGT